MDNLPIGKIQFEKNYGKGFETGAPYATKTQSEKERITGIVIEALRESPELRQALKSAIIDLERVGELRLSTAQSSDFHQ